MSERQYSAADIARANRADEGPVLAVDEESGHAADPISLLFQQQMADPVERSIGTMGVPVKDFDPVPIADLPVSGRYVFMSKPGFRSVGLNIDVPERTDDDERAAKIEKVFTRRFRGREGVLDFNKRVADEDELSGVPLIQFKPIPGKFQCIYETDSKLIAEYIRHTPEFVEGRIYEQTRPLTITVNGVEVQVVAADNASRVALAAALAQE